MTAIASISAPVGAGFKALNRHGDVVAVQSLLNGVTQKDGGPRPPLLVDGVCGKKTQATIQQFQLKHFGWKLADGRVDPGGETLGRLIQLSSAARLENGSGSVPNRLPVGIPASAAARSRPGPAWLRHATLGPAGKTTPTKAHSSDRPSSDWQLYSLGGGGLAGPLGGTVLYFQLLNRLTGFYYAAYVLLFSPGLAVGASASLDPKGSKFSIAGGRAVMVDVFHGRKVDCWSLGASYWVGYSKSGLRFYGLPTVPREVDLSGYSIGLSTPVGGYGGTGRFYIS